LVAGAGELGAMVRRFLEREVARLYKRLRKGKVARGTMVDCRKGFEGPSKRLPDARVTAIPSD